MYCSCPPRLPSQGGSRISQRGVSLPASGLPQGDPRLAVTSARSYSSSSVSDAVFRFVPAGIAGARSSRRDHALSAQSMLGRPGPVTSITSFPRTQRLARAGGRSELGLCETPTTLSPRATRAAVVAAPMPSEFPTIRIRFAMNYIRDRGGPTTRHGRTLTSWQCWIQSRNRSRR